MPPDPPELSEDVDLDMNQRRYVLDVFARINQLTYYDLLGVAPDADKKAIKRAYFGLVGTIHPDRYFNKRLGSYKPKLEAIFARMTKAHEVLLSKDLRAKYDEALAAIPHLQDAARKPAPVDPKVAQKRQEAMDALKQRFEGVRAKAKQHADTAARAKAAGDYVSAAEAYKAALAITPQDAAIKAAYEEVSRLAAVRLADAHVKQAILEERYGHWAEAAESWRRVVAARPDDAQARGKLETALEKASKKS
jgi:curved DNA-binding protein CbpA